MSRWADIMNRVQERVVAFEQDGGVEGLARRAARRARLEEERLAAGRHPLNPEYQTQVRLWYARLELDHGAGAGEVRQAFRDLMRRYHPDRFSGNDESEALATRLSQDLTVAYEGLLEYLNAR